MSQALDELYGVPVDEFIAKRDELAKKLKAEGDKDGAAEVKKAHKPTLAAHALNLLAREARAELEELFAASAALASGKSFKESLERQRAALDAVRKKARGDDAPAVVQVVQGAAAVPELAQAVLLGRFARLPEVPVGFFGAAPEGAPKVVVPVTVPAPKKTAPPPVKLVPPPSPPKPAPSPPKPKVDKALERKLKAAEKQLERAKEDVAELEEELAEARKRAQEAEEHVAELKKQL